MESICRTRSPRLAIYGVGQYGQILTRFAARKGLPIVAAFNRSGPKVGQDLGRVAGLDHDLGVVIQDCDTADYSQLDADVGLVAQTNLLKVNLPAYQRLMGAGLNVLCHGTQSYYPFGNDAEAAAEIDEIAKSNHVTFSGSGIWDMSRIWSGILVAGNCTEITALHHRSLTDIAGQLINKEQAEQGGIGFSLDDFDGAGHKANPVTRSYKTIPEQVLVALGYHVSGYSVGLEPITFDVPIESELMGGTVPAGHVVGVRVVAEVETKEGVRGRADIELRLRKDEKDVEFMLWSVEGKPRTSIRVERQDSDHATAACLFNRIPDVIAAPPGIVPVHLLGPLKPSATL